MSVSPSSLIVEQVTELVKLSSLADEIGIEQTVVDSGIVDYLESIVDEAVKADDLSLVVDLEGLKEVLDSFLPALSSISSDSFSSWFDSLLAKRIVELETREMEKPAEAAAESLPSTSFLSRRRKSSSLQENVEEKDPKEVESAVELSENMMKQLIIDKFSYVAEDEYQKEHRPHLTLNEDKKLLRFRNSQVVSTKGERFTIEKPPETEEIKRTYVHIGQYRRFKFH